MQETELEESVVMGNPEIDRSLVPHGPSDSRAKQRVQNLALVGVVRAVMFSRSLGKTN